MEETTDFSQTHPYTCNSCQVAFRNSEAQRTHMRSDWHRYNLKRRVASLPPIPSEVFNEKVQSAQATSNAAAAKAAFEKVCTTCQKTYYSENSYENHLGSQKHKQKLSSSQKGSSDDSGSLVSLTFSLGEPISFTSPPTENRDSEAEKEFDKVVEGLKDTSLEAKGSLLARPSGPTPSSTLHLEEHPLSPVNASNPETPADSSPNAVPLSRCLFCNYDSPTWKLSVAHMTKIHGLFIPEQSYLVDLEGLLQYFQAKINQNHECLYCHKLKITTGAVQTHMRDKGHCMVAFESEEEMVEVGQFYDFSGTYSDAEDDTSSADTEMAEPLSKVNGGVKLPQGAKTEEADEDGWETDSSFSSLDSNDLASVPIDDHSHQYERLPLNRHHSHTDPRPHRNADGFHSHAHHHGANAVFYDDFEMHLPSGRSVGHRSLKKYYKQNLHDYPSAAERLEKAQKMLEDEGEEDESAEEEQNPAAPNRSSALARRSEAGMIGATTAQKREVRAAEKRGRRQGERDKNRYQAKVEKQNNSQKHFRDPLLQ